MCLKITLVPFENLDTVSYSPSVLTMALFCIGCDIQLIFDQKWGNFYTAPCI